ncbi:MAG: CDP-diacylglycerol--serine O-phosphatidyltransferase [Myxococcota bacterium]|nr:CDP-diacylglycerol--serine O-phosphatidyltransferase [Myxococcota bacterium]
MDEVQEPGRRRRRRRRRDPGEPGELFGRGFGPLLPHLLTTGNLAAGFYAIVKASDNVWYASWAILVAAIFDMLDGRAARLTKSESRFGVEYDSIADTVSFCVAPAVIAFHAGAFRELGFWPGPVMAFVFTACGALRLARFNVTSGRYAGRFDGLPTPAAAGMVASTVWFTEGFLRQDIGLPLGLPPMIPALGLVALGLLMVSPIPYRSFKDIRVPRSNGSIVVAVLAVLLLAMKPTLTFFVVGIIYVGHGPVAGYWRYRTGRELPSADPATASDAPQEAGS